MKDYAEPLARLIDELKRLPGIGPKSAQRLAFHLERVPREEAERLAGVRSEERRVGKECIEPCRSRWSPYH